jgi:hypothetical protein
MDNCTLSLLIYHAVSRVRMLISKMTCSIDVNLTEILNPLVVDHFEKVHLPCIKISEAKQN